MSKASEAGKSFLAGVLAKISDPEKRAQAEAALADDAALEVLGSGALAQSDINKRYDDLKAKEDALTEDYTRLNGWYETNKAKLEEYDTLKKQPPADPLAPRPPADPKVDLSKYVDLETFGKTMNDQQMQAANYLGLQNALTLQHYDRFKEVIDTRDLLADKNLGKQKPDGGIYGLKDAYEAKYAEKLTSWSTQQEQARINKLVEERLAEERKNQPSNQPFPLKAAPSALDLLEPDSKEKPSDFTAERAAAHYAELVAKSASA